MDLVDRRRVGDFLVVAGADLRVGDLAGDLASRPARCAGRARAGIPCGAGNRGSCRGPSADRLCGQQPDLDDRRHCRGAALLRRQAARTAGRDRSSASSRSASVIGWPLMVARRSRAAAAARPAPARGAGCAASSAQPAAAPSRRRRQLRNRRAARAAEQGEAHRRVSGRVGIRMEICRANGRFPRRCERRCNVDIGSAPSYLSFDFASRSDFRALFDC